MELPIEREISPWKDCVALYRLFRFYRSVRPDIVVAGTPKAGLLGTLAARLARVPARVYLQHGLRMETTRGPKRLLLYAAERTASICANRVVCVSKSLRALNLRLGLSRPDKAVVLAAGSANGVDADRFHRSAELRGQAAVIRSQLGIPADAPVVGFVGRLTRDKGAPELLAAFKRVQASAPDAWLLIVGRPESGDPLPEGVEHGLMSHPQVVVTGNVDEPAPYIGAMDVFAFPSLREGFGVVLLEAAAAGLPAAAFRATGVVDAVVDGVTGTLVPVGDAEALADAVVQYLQDPDLSAKHGTNARERAVRDFCPARIWKAFHDEFVSLMRGAASSACAPVIEEASSHEETAVSLVETQ